jgi:F0F1-type ATP synthase assembly protein I
MVVSACVAGAVVGRQRPAPALMPGPAQGSGRDAIAAFVALTGIATTSAICVVAGVALGWLVDDRVGAPHVFVFLGLVAGIAAAVWSAMSIARKYLKP